METNTTPVSLVQEMKTAYGDYAMAVLIGRAIPDLYDGMKPVTRRILTAMKWLNLKPDGKFMKSARVDGEVMGKLHPHGGAYGAMVTAAAPHNNNVPYINGHGNWGSPTDNAAASRYTECKLTEFAWDVLLDDFDICETRPTYDGSFQEPIRLETKVPVALLNGIEGIGVGYATKIAPHNLKDVCKAVELVIKGDKKKAAETLLPDFPSGCDVVRNDSLREYAVSGTGAIQMRARVEENMEKRARSERVMLTFTHLPFQTNTERLGEQIKKGLEQGKLNGIAEVRDESDREGDRLVVVLKPKVESKTVLPYLYHYTDLQSSYAAKSLLIDGTKPVEVAPYQLVERWVAWRMDRLVVKFTTEREKLEKRVHIVDGLLKAIDSLDLVIGIIRKAKDKSDAKAKLMTHRSLKLSSEQAEAVLEMRLRQLTNLDTDELVAEKEEKEGRIANLSALIASPGERSDYILSEVKAISKQFGFTRRSAIVEAPEDVPQASVRTPSEPRPAKLRFIKIDAAKGVLEQLKKPRGANIITEREKLVFLTDNGMFKKVAPTYKGPLYDGPTKILSRGVESEITSRTYLVVFQLGEQLKAMSLSGEDLCRTTSKGKSYLPADATLVYFGEDPYTVKFASKRKKDVVLTAATAKAARPGAKGSKVASLTDLA
jgi:DNA gyrase subunit A